MYTRAALILCGLSSLILADIQSGHPINSHQPSASTASDSSATTPTTNSQTSRQTTVPSSCSSGSLECCGTRTITTLAVLSSLANCSTFQGDLTLSDIFVPRSSSPSDVFTIHVPIQSISGSLEINGIGSQDGAVYALGLDNLTTVTGNLTFRDLHQLQMPNLTALQTATSISFIGVTFDNAIAPKFQYSPGNGALESLSATRYLSFQDTNIQAIGPFGSGYSLSIYLPEPAGMDATIFAVNNAQLQSVDISGLYGVTTNLTIQGNVECKSITMSDVGNIGNAVIENNGLTSLLLPRLTTSGAMEIKDNTELSTLTLPSLDTLDDSLVIIGNSALTSINMPQLTTIDSSLTIQGPIKTLNLSPTLDNVNGQISVVSSGSLDCGPIKRINQVSGRPVCKNSTSGGASSVSQSPPGSTATHGAPSSSNPHTSGLSSKETIGIGVGVGVGGALLLAVAIYLCWRSHRRNSRNQRTTPDGTYSRPNKAYGGSEDFLSYREVPYEPGGGDGGAGVGGAKEELQSEEHIPSSAVGMNDAWVPSRAAPPAAGDRREPEEHPGMRHEMDARSIDFQDDDDEAETRSLEDIERVHRQT